jgi:UDP-3-O-[3-hydroxymyristoyl] glucosamine N-acyltransferase
MSSRLGKLVERLGGQLIGDADIEVVGIAPLDDATASHITFLSNPKLRVQAAQTQAAALILSPSDDAVVSETYKGARIVTDNPYAYFAKAAQVFAEANAIPPIAGIHPTAVVDSTAIVATSATIGPHVVIEADAIIGEHVQIDANCFIGRGARIGAFTHFFANVVFHAHCEIGERGILHSGAVIGADGFGFANEGGVWIKIPQVGRVMIGNDVDIGANTAIDRGALADTIIEDGVKLDNLIQIGHNCHIGAHTAMAGCIAIAGSTKFGKYCTVGGGSLIAGHLDIADKTHIAGGSAVIGPLSGPGQYAGPYPAMSHREWEKNTAILRNLSGLREKIRALEKTIKSLIKNHNG